MIEKASKVSSLMPCNHCDHERFKKDEGNHIRLELVCCWCGREDRVNKWEGEKEHGKFKP